MPEVPAFDEGAAHGGPFRKDDGVLRILCGVIQLIDAQGVAVKNIAFQNKTDGFLAFRGGRTF